MSNVRLQMTGVRVLYRYRSLSGQSREWVRRSIVHGEHYFASPLSFNDPFDCRPTIRRTGNDEQLANYYDRVLAASEPWLLPRSRKKLAQDIVYRARQRGTLSQTDEVVHRELVTGMISRLGILCLSEVPDDLLMWAHYADCHRGICLVLDATYGLLEDARPVRYQDARPILNPVTQESEELITAALYTKSPHWAYEKEWRVLRHRTGPGVCDPGALRLQAIILGAQVTVDQCTELKQWAGDSADAPQVLRAKLSQHEFKLTIAPEA